MSKPSAKRRAAIRRRNTLLGLLAIIALAAGLLVWQPWKPAGGAKPTPSVTPVATATSKSPEPTSTFTTGQESAAPGSTAAGMAPCEAGSVQITPVTDKAAYGAGEVVKLWFEVVNTGAAACSIEAGTGAQEYEIKSGADSVWRFSHCRAGATNDTAVLVPGEKRSSQPIEWDRTRSSSSTCTAERPKVAAGTYQLRVNVGSFASSGTARFTLAG